MTSEAYEAAGSSLGFGWINACCRDLPSSGRFAATFSRKPSRRRALSASSQLAKVDGVAARALSCSQGEGEVSRSVCRSLPVKSASRLGETALQLPPIAGLDEGLRESAWRDAGHPDRREIHRPADAAP